MALKDLDPIDAADHHMMKDPPRTHSCLPWHEENLPKGQNLQTK